MRADHPTRSARPAVWQWPSWCCRYGPSAKASNRTSVRGGAHSIRKKAKARKPRPILPGFGAGGSGQLQRRHFLPGRAV